jgi:ribosomal protein S18 acetylase RimI-like enzyme
MNTPRRLAVSTEDRLDYIVSDHGKGSIVTANHTSEHIAVRRATGAAQDQALSLLLTGKRTADASAVEQFRGFAEQQALSLEHTWVAAQGDRVVASALIVPAKGCTAMFFLSPTADPKIIPVAARLARVASAELCRGQTNLIQALLDPAQTVERDALTHAGYMHLARLVYMERRVREPYAPLSLDPRLTVHHYSARTRRHFADAILASYQDTRDCPGLLGLRDIDDIIAGHQATGEFEPRLWFALTHGDESVGVMLLNKVPQRSALELVYLGLSPAWRGKGIARQLIEHGIALVTKQKLSTMVLAVDDINAPALRLYRQLSFAENGRKVAMIFTLSNRDEESC